ncbi:transcriptional regulator [Haloferax denitrificans]|uniref:transcriptional regulator n=1 Tax=Haloferax denitrificans TaxID=35745 RepID=UPI003C6FFDC1
MGYGSAYLSNRPIEVPFVTADRDDESGQFTEQYSEEEFLKAVRNIDHATTAKIAEEVECSYDLAYRRLNVLADNGKIKRIEVGSSFIWEY